MLRDLLPELYAREAPKYAGREAVLAFRIPILEVLWNDVVHLVAGEIETAGLDVVRS